VSDGVSEVDEVPQASLALVNGDDVRLDVDGAGDNLEQKSLILGPVRRESAGGS